MISRFEVLEQAKLHNLSSNVIEKDYALGWVLAGINANNILRDTLVFKGGTALKKCFFGNYRFFEDLDFTVIDKLLNESELISEFKKVSKFVYEHSGLEIAVDRTDFEIYKNSRNVINCQGRLYYKGPVSAVGQRQWPRIKIDLTTNEILVADPVERKVINNYSDFANELFKIRTYCFEELLAEKIRALEERCMPRDIYDVVYCMRQKLIKFDYELVTKILQKKCDFKGITVPTKGSIFKYKTLSQAAWHHQLAHQISELDSFENMWSTLEEIISAFSQNQK